MTKLTGRAAINNLLGLDCTYLWCTDKLVQYRWVPMMERTQLEWSRNMAKEGTGQGGGRGNGNPNSGKGSDSGGAGDGRSQGGDGNNPPPPRREE